MIKRLPFTKSVSTSAFVRLNKRQNFSLITDIRSGERIGGGRGERAQIGPLPGYSGYRLTLEAAGQRFLELALSL